MYSDLQYLHHGIFIVTQFEVHKHINKNAYFFSGQKSLHRHIY